MRLRFQYHLQPTYILRVRISRFVLSSYTPGVDAVNEQARTDATPWRCLNMGILFDLLVDAACKVTGFFWVPTMGELLFHSLLARMAPILLMKALLTVRTLHPLHAEVDLVKPTFCRDARWASNY